MSALSTLSTASTPGEELAEAERYADQCRDRYKALLIERNRITREIEDAIRDNRLAQARASELQHRSRRDAA